MMDEFTVDPAPAGVAPTNVHDAEPIEGRKIKYCPMCGRKLKDGEDVERD